MDFMMWLLVLLRVLRALGPWIMGVVFGVIVLSMVSPLPRYLAVLAFGLAVCWGAGVFAREFFGPGGRRPDDE